jgi:hypothetical protein
MLDSMHIFFVGNSIGRYESSIYGRDQSPPYIDKWKYEDGYGPPLPIHAGVKGTDSLIPRPRNLI